VGDKNVSIDNPNKKFLVTADVGLQPPIPEGRGMLVKLYFSTTDIGTLIVDTTANSPLPEEHLLFSREDSVTYVPRFRRGEFPLVSEEDPNDPAGPDSVSFYPDRAYYPLPSGPGIFYAHIQVVNDGEVGAMILPFHWSGPVSFDSVTFRESVFEELEYRIVNPDTVSNKVMIGGIPVSEPPIPPARGLFTTLCFTVYGKTDLVTVDTSFFPPVNHFGFTTDGSEPMADPHSGGVWWYAPQFALGEFPVLEYWPGDVTFDGRVDIGDIVFLLNYAYTNGPPPPHPISADVNEPDGVIDIEDIVYLITYLFKEGPNPLPGDPW